MRLSQPCLYYSDVRKLTVKVMDETCCLWIHLDDEPIVGIFFDSLDEALRTADSINSLDIRPTTEARRQPRRELIDEEIPF